MKIAYLAPLLALTALLVLLVSGPGVHLGLWAFPIGFQLLKWAAYAGLAGAFAGVVFLAIPPTRRRHAKVLAAAIVVGLGIAWIPWHALQNARLAPGIHDISTDTLDPPPFVAVLPLRISGKAVNSTVYGGSAVAAQQLKAYVDIRTLDLQIPPADAFNKALSAARAMGWAIDATVPADGRIEATATTLWFAFKDDIVVRIRPNASGSRIDVRSESRVGGSDVGTNAARIRSYLNRLRSET
ncbi:MAG: DUF1499 domain-containing protein [Rhodanobacter sp.]